MRKKGANQLRSNCIADQRLCFRYTVSIIRLVLKSEISSFYPAPVTDRFMSELVGNSEDRFSRVGAFNVLGYLPSTDATPLLSRCLRTSAVLVPEINVCTSCVLIEKTACCKMKHSVSSVL